MSKIVCSRSSILNYFIHKNNNKRRLHKFSLKELKMLKRLKIGLHKPSKLNSCQSFSKFKKRPLKNTKNSLML